MLVNQNQTRNWTAISAVNVTGGTGDPVMYMNASYNGKDLNMSKSIQNHDLYKQYKDEVNADYNAFEQMVLDAIGD